MNVLSRLHDLPRPADPDAAAHGLSRFREVAAERGLASFAEALAAEPAGRALLEAVFGNSPYLSRILLAEPAFLARILAEGPDAALPAVLAELRGRLAGSADTATLMRELRIAKRRVALLVALADIGGLWGLNEVTENLSAFADAALDLAVAHLLREAAARGEIALADADRPERGNGYFVLGLGKLGARELNYSSDIDLIVLYDGERVRYTGPRSMQECMVRITRELVRLLEERTGDGYVFRCDLRLRPDAGATPLALSTLAAETYYESLGQNWERAAMIKARPVAGDIDAAAAFLKILVPYVWRRHLDFAAIQDIHSIKRQIDAHRGLGDICVPGHNLKLGRGGIREIEFFAQTQQLIWGGRMPGLRVRGTCEAIAALAAGGRISDTAARDLIGAYAFLRRVEHRLQMIDDQQTHTLPADDAGLARLAIFLGFEGPGPFIDALHAHLRNVERHYAALFEEAPALSGPGNLVFTGTEHDPETLATLKRLGFANPEAVSATIMGWHHGRYAATRSVRARELLTELVPALLAAFARTAEPDLAFMRFDQFLARLPAGVALFSLFQSNPPLLDLVAEVMGNAPRLAELLAHRPILFDAVLTPGFFEPLPPAPALEAELAEALRSAPGFEQVLDAARRWAADKRFQVGVQILRDIVKADAAAPMLSDIAAAAVRALQPLVEDEFSVRHGRVAGGALATVALGRLGGREMTPSSDLDLVFVYDHAPGAEASDGPKPLSTHEYFARASRRLINALTARTSEGVLYEVDMRLRPSGSSGPIASSLEAFRRYQDESAWTWEHLALTRARVLTGPPELARAIEETVRRVLTRRRHPGKLAFDVQEMRERIAREHPARSGLDVKHLRGGLLDVEFIAQFVQLRDAHACPEILSPGTVEALERAGRCGALPGDVAAELAGAARFWQRILGTLRLCYPTPPAEEQVSEGLRRLLARAAGVTDFAALREQMDETAALVRAHFRDLIAAKAEAPADAEAAQSRKA